MGPKLVFNKLRVKERDSIKNTNRKRTQKKNQGKKCKESYKPQLKKTKRIAKKL